MSEPPGVRLDRSSTPYIFAARARPFGTPVRRSTLTAVSEIREAVIVDCVRTAFGRRKGALAAWHPADLLGFALRHLLLERNPGLDPERIDDVVGGCVNQVGEQSNNVARNAWVGAGLPWHVPATTVDRQCGSSQQAVQFVAASV